jgi:hypothetical protein
MSYARWQCALPARIHVHSRLQSRPVAPVKAIKLRDQLLRKIESVALEGAVKTQSVWSHIETRVVMLMDWVLYQKHTA